MFKNAIGYILDGKIDVDQLNLSDFKFKECGPYDLTSSGWLQMFDEYTLKSHDVTMIKLGLQEKILPRSVINENLADHIKEAEERCQRKLTKKEISEAKDYVIEGLLPLAFVKTTEIKAYICDDKIVVNTSSEKKAELVLDMLRKSLGSLKVTPIGNKCESLDLIMTNHILSSAPDGFVFGDYVKLKSQLDGGTVICKEEDVMSEEVISYIKEGKMVSEIKLIHGGAEFKLCSDAKIKSIKIQQPEEDEEEDEYSLAITNLFISAKEINGAFDDIIKLTKEEK